jgi:hypothetical protein
MALYSKEFLSEGTGDGRGILVVGTNTGTATAIHTAHATALDEIHLWAFNTHTADLLLTIEWGGTTALGDTIEYTVPTSDGLYMVAPGLPLTNLVVNAFAGSANLITLFGYVNRTT